MWVVPRAQYPVPTDALIWGLCQRDSTGCLGTGTLFTTPSEHWRAAQDGAAEHSGTPTGTGLACCAHCVWIGWPLGSPLARDASRQLCPSSGEKRPISSSSRLARVSPVFYFLAEMESCKLARKQKGEAFHLFFSIGEPLTAIPTNHLLVTGHLPP